MICLLRKWQSIKNIESIDTKLRIPPSYDSYDSDDTTELWQWWYHRAMMVMIPPSYDSCRDQQQNITGWFFCIFKACISFFIFRDFPRYQGPVGAMYQSVGKCFRMHLRAASILKISGGLGGPLTPRRFFGAQLPLRPVRWHFRLARTLISAGYFVQCLDMLCMFRYIAQEH